MHQLLWAKGFITLEGVSRKSSASTMFTFSIPCHLNGLRSLFREILLSLEGGTPQHWLGQISGSLVVQVVKRHMTRYISWISSTSIGPVQFQPMVVQRLQ